MSGTNQPFGFRPAFHPSGQIRSMPYAIASGYAANIFKGDPVKLVTGGTIELMTSDGTRTGTTDTVNGIGVFAGVEYLDSDGKPVVSAYWPSGVAATNVRAYVWDDPEIEFDVQADGSIAATAIGDQADWTGFAAPGGSTRTGLSSATLSSTLAGAGVQAQFRVMDITRELDNAAGDAFTVVRVKFAEHQYVAVKVAV